MFAGIIPINYNKTLTVYSEGIVEMRGVEPLSEDPSAGFSPSAFRVHIPIRFVHEQTKLTVASLIQV